MYGTIGDWRAYASARGNTEPTQADDSVATAALVRASDHIKYRYVANLRPSSLDHSELIEHATYVIAAIELERPDFFAKTYTPGQQRVLIAVEGVRWRTVGPEAKTYAAAPVSTLVEAMFAPYVIDRDGDDVGLMVIG